MIQLAYYAWYASSLCFWLQAPASGQSQYPSLYPTSITYMEYVPLRQHMLIQLFYHWQAHVVARSRLCYRVFGLSASFRAQEVTRWTADTEVVGTTHYHDKSPTSPYPGATRSRQADLHVISHDFISGRLRRGSSIIFNPSCKYDKRLQHLKNL